jgi:hypothetical protein
MGFARIRSDSDGRLTAIWESQPEPGAWRLSYYNGTFSPEVATRFEWHAQTAAAQLGCQLDGKAAMAYWLDLIKSDLPKSHRRRLIGGDQLESIEILDVCHLSAEYCGKCEGDEIRAARQDHPVNVDAGADSLGRPRRSAVQGGVQEGSNAADILDRDAYAGRFKFYGSHHASSGMASCQSGAKDTSKLIELAAEFRRGSELFRSLRLQPRAELYAEVGRGEWGIWRLRPQTSETEPAWVTFSLLASRAIEELGIAPMAAPHLLEFDPRWREQCRAMRVDDSVTIPAGLEAVDPCTRAWLHFLRRESLQIESPIFQVHSAGGSFPDVCEASAIQCERSARERIQANLESAQPIDGANGVGLREGTVDSAIPAVEIAPVHASVRQHQGLTLNRRWGVRRAKRTSSPL